METEDVTKRFVESCRKIRRQLDLYRTGIIYSFSVSGEDIRNFLRDYDNTGDLDETHFLGK